MLTHFCYFDVFLFKQKTAYEMRIIDWSSDVCSSDLLGRTNRLTQFARNATFFPIGIAAQHMFTPKTWADRVLLIGIVDRGLWFEEIFQCQPMSRDEIYEEKGLDWMDHDASPKRVRMRKPARQNTQKSERGRTRERGERKK